jgi:lipopolysaccharide exporter
MSLDAVSPAAPSQTGGSPLRRMAKGSAWMVAARWSIRSIGLVSTIILARLLSPADFGIVAMAMIVVGFVQVFSAAGQNLAIIRHPDPTAEHFDTAWTISACAGVVVALVLVAIAPLGARYFGDARLVPVIRVLALAPLISGFTNVGAVAGFRKDLNFDKEFRFLVLRKLSSFVITVPLAFILRDYWAMVFGIVGGELLTAGASYRMHPYRPRLRLGKLSEMWSYSMWMQLASIGGFLLHQIDQIIVGHLSGTAGMGRYNVAGDIATAPTSELVLPAGRAVFPVYATLLNDPAKLARSYLNVLSIVALLAISTSVGVALVAHDMVMLVLGAKWMRAVALVPWLALAGGMFIIIYTAIDVLSVTGNARPYALRCWSFVAMLAPAAGLAGFYWGSEGVAAARAIVTVLFLPLMFYSVMEAIPVTAGQIAACLWRPFVSALAMAAVVELAGGEGIATLPLRLFCTISIGAMSFVATLLCLWVVAGRPPGAEHMLIEQARGVARRLYGGKTQSPPLTGGEA